MLPIAPLAFAFGGPQDWIIILVVALLLFGPKKLPEVGKQLGQAMREFNKLKDELTGAAHSLRDEVESVYEPIAKPYSQSHPVSSATVDAAAAHRVYDQEPTDLMAPVVPHIETTEANALAHHEAQPIEHQEPKPLEPAAIGSVPETEHEKGH
jgi:sec-independent protein translocase protein TatA